MWWTKFILLIAVTVSVTWFIVCATLWLEKNKQKYPRLYSQKGVFSFFLWLVLSSGDIR